jgi:hypothetical protein
MICVSLRFEALFGAPSMEHPFSDFHADLMSQRKKPGAVRAGPSERTLK